jgi:uncharacterized protein YndB with AHSA1/START domain
MAERKAQSGGPNEQVGVMDGQNVGEREIVISRFIEAPRELVFEAYLDPEHLIHWWGPNGFRLTIHEIDVRPGGVWRYTMHGPDGRDYPNKMVYLKIVRPELIVMDHSGDEGEPVSHVMTNSFEVEGKGTRVTLRLQFPTAAERERTVREYKAIEGGKQTMQRLADHVAAMAVGQDMVKVRMINAPVDRVFDAWIDPVQLAQWWGPRGFTNPVCEVDPRPGGKMRIDMRAPDGTVYPMIGVIEIVERPRRLVFTSAALDKDGKALFEVLTTVTFSELSGQTEVTVWAKASKVSGIAAQYLTGMNEGWNQSLDRLGELVGRK